MKNPNKTAIKRRAENEDVVRPDTIIVASGRYGSCTQYTKWLMDRLGADAIPYSKQTFGYISLYRNVIFIGAIKEAVIWNSGILWQNYSNFGLQGKKIIVAGVGLGDPDNKDYFDKVMARSGSSQGFSSNYILPGRINKAGLKRLDRPIFDKFLVDAGRVYGRETAELINERAASDYNGVNAETIDPIVQEILLTRE